MKKTVNFLVLIVVLATADLASACSAFLIRHNGAFLMGRNYDYMTGMGVLMVNPPGLDKVALPYPDEECARWVSRYGSVTLNPIGREQPVEGMNEKGLVIAGLWLETTQYPTPDGRPMVDDLQWIQYMLDNCANIEEVVAAMRNVRITRQSVPKLHFFLADAGGNFAVIEFVNGQPRQYVNDEATKAFICNDTFEKSSTDLKKYTPWGGENPVMEGFRNYIPEEAVVMGADMLARYDGDLPLNDYAFDILEKVQAPRGTPQHPEYGSQWSVVYDPVNLKFAFTTLANSEIRNVDINVLDFEACEVKAVSIASSRAGDIVPQLGGFAKEENHQLFREAVKAFLGVNQLNDFLEQEIKVAAETPYAYSCRHE